MKKIALIFLGQILIVWLFLEIFPVQIQKAKAETKNYPAGIVFQTGTADNSYMSSADVGTAQNFPGGKLKSDYCKDSEGYETFPDGTIYPAAQKEKERLEANLNFQDKYPTAFECNGNPRYFWGGDLVLAASAATSPALNSSSSPGSGAAIASPPEVKDIDLDILGLRFNTVPELVQGIITWLLGFAGAFAVIALVYSGIMYLTAGADPTKAENAKKNLVWAVTGIVVIVLSYAIIRWIANIISTGNA